jgi:hypothetical protein
LQDILKKLIFLHYFPAMSIDLLKEFSDQKATGLADEKENNSNRGRVYCSATCEREGKIGKASVNYKKGST